MTRTGLALVPEILLVLVLTVSEDAPVVEVDLAISRLARGDKSANR